MITLNSIPIPNPEVVDRVMDNEAVLVHPARGKVKVLNEVGAVIWTAIDGSRSAREIAEAVFEQYSVEIGEAEKDTLAFLNTLLAKELIFKAE